ncbi:MAG: hypothetical protein L0H79_12775, partial [Intrasporangium sp.]|nr:hypothetical protein [Intrasporangium sp.]
MTQRSALQRSVVQRPADHDSGGRDARATNNTADPPAADARSDLAEPGPPGQAATVEDDAPLLDAPSPDAPSPDGPLLEVPVLDSTTPDDTLPATTGTPLPLARAADRTPEPTPSVGA